MEHLLFQEVDLDVCPGCAGIWFDLGELEEILGTKAPSARDPGLTTRKCPRCAFRLKPYRMAKGVEVDKCTGCEGVYLDAGELELLRRQLLERQPEAATWRIAEPQRPGQARRDVAGASFVCPSCGGTFPMAQGNATGSGLKCPACTPQVDMPDWLRERANSLGADTADRIGQRQLMDFALTLALLFSR